MKVFRNLRVLARFSPRTTDDLDPDLLNLVGTDAVFSYHKFVDDEDTPYANQWLLTSEDQRFGEYWYPESDLEILRVMRSAQG
jgi:hypothetical protein